MALAGGHPVPPGILAPDLSTHRRCIPFATGIPFLDSRFYPAHRRLKRKRGVAFQQRFRRLYQGWIKVKSHARDWMTRPARGLPMPPGATRTGCGKQLLGRFNLFSRECMKSYPYMRGRMICCSGCSPRLPSFRAHRFGLGERITRLGLDLAGHVGQRRDETSLRTAFVPFPGRYSTCAVAQAFYACAKTWRCLSIEQYEHVSDVC